MSRVANKPVVIAKGVEVNITGQVLTVKGAKGSLTQTFAPGVEITLQDEQLLVRARIPSKQGVAYAGTVRALANNLVIGVSQGYEKKLLLVGVGYRAQVQGDDKINLSLGFSHPVVYQLPVGIKAETPTQTEIIIRGTDKQVVGQVAAEIRRFRPPEPYKGKGVRYSDERVVIKETKKK